MIDLGIELSIGVHVTFALLSAIIVSGFIGMLLSGQNIKTRLIKAMGLLLPIFLTVTYVSAGWWYVTYYPKDKALILKGPLPEAHEIGMETKEHIFIPGFWLGVVLSIIMLSFPTEKFNDPLVRKSVILLGATFLLGFIVLDFLGAYIAIGVKTALKSLTGG